MRIVLVRIADSYGVGSPIYRDFRGIVSANNVDHKASSSFGSIRVTYNKVKDVLVKLSLS